MSLRARSCVLAGLVSAFLGLVLCVGLAAQGYRTDLEGLNAQLATASRRMALLAVEGVLPNPIPKVNGQCVQIVADDGRVLASTPDLAGQGPITRQRPPAGDVRWDGVVRHDGQELLTVGFTFTDIKGTSATVYVATPKPGFFHDVPGLLALSAAALVGVAAVLILTWVLVSRALKPVEAIRAELSEITATDPHRRVPETGRQDEIAALVTTVNQTLDRLDGALSQQRSFVADASHELRNPITGLRAEVDLALMETDGAAHAALEAVDRAADRLQLLVEDLLAVARLDAGMEPRPEPVDLAALVTDELTRRHPAKTVLTELAAGVVVEGDRLQLARVLVNLLDNALRHADSAVSVRVGADGEQAVLAVTDDGAGLAPEDRERVFQRFTRLAEGRVRDPGGSGLGLPIAREIARRHGGTLLVEDRATFVLRLPLMTRSAMTASRHEVQPRLTA
ncbi:sensor histidine kinase [Nonomuraea typhae]|uniref:sensor histidine kinase n=1 Tax=Nonomuraea typhae TaxID=2603600 RepID=UPI0012FC3E79|nr:HAMP domain-containing sensor histidine kinase [Nonomuraea typhae]